MRSPFQGITIKPLVRILNVKRAEKRKPTMNERIHERVRDVSSLIEKNRVEERKENTRFVSSDRS